MSNPFTAGYKAPKLESSYLKFIDEGTYLVRILTPKTEVITYFSEFVEKQEGGFEKIVYEDKGDGRIPKGENPDPKKSPKLNWGVVVFDKDDEKVKIWEISQKSIQNFLFAIASGKIKNDWTKFDIQITKKGQKMETEYTLIADDTKPLSKEHQAIVDDEYPKINLKAMEKGKNPFENSEDENNEPISESGELPDVDEAVQNMQF